MVGYFEIFKVVVFGNYRSCDYYNYPLFRFYLNFGLFWEGYASVGIGGYIILSRLF